MFICLLQTNTNIFLLIYLLLYFAVADQPYGAAYQTSDRNDNSLQIVNTPYKTNRSTYHHGDTHVRYIVTCVHACKILSINLLHVRMCYSICKLIFLIHFQTSLHTFQKLLYKRIQYVLWLC